MVEIYGLPSRYSDFSLLGSGGIGTVFKAVDSRIDRVIALKILNNLDSALSASIENEFSTLTKLKHPNLIMVHDFGQSDSGHSYFTMDYIDGPNLNEYFLSPDSILTSCNILMGILEALDYLARKNRIHGDIKPENILISNEDRTKPVLVDFGLSTIAAINHDRLFGTPRFLAPEIISSRQYSSKSDLYALGHSFIESHLQNETPLADNLTDKYLYAAQESLSRLYQDSGIEYPRNLASYIVGLSNPSLDLRPGTPSQAIQKLSAISKPSSDDRTILSAEYIVRAEIDRVVDHFIEGEDFNNRALLLKGPIGVGKRSLMARAISNAQLLKYRVINYIETQAESFSLENILDVLSINLSDTSSKKLFEQHQKLLSKIKKAEETRDLDNIGVIYSNIVEYIHHLSQDQPVLIAISNIESVGLDTLRFITHLINEIDYLKTNVKVILSHSTDYSHNVELDKHLTSLADSVNILPVRGFNVTEAKDLCHELFDSDLFTDAEIDFILSFTDGIPLYILDYFNYLLLNDIINKRGRNYYADHKQIIKTYSITKYNSMVDSIVSDMTSNEVHLLQLLSIYKQPVDLSLLDRFVSYDLPGSVQECVIAGLVELHSGTIQLRSPILKNNLSQNIGTEQLITLYRTLANYTLLANPDNFSLIADYFIRAHAPEEAYEYVIMAYEKHLSSHEYYSAHNILSSLNSVIDEINSREMKTTVLEKLSSLEFTLGYSDDSLKNYHKLIDMATDEIATSTYYIKIGRIERYFKGNTDKAVEHYKLALEIARRHSSIELESKALLSLGIALQDVSFLETAAAITKDVMPTRYVAALSQTMLLCLFSGSTDKCKSIEKELNKYLSHDDPSVLSKIYDAKYTYAFFTGNYTVANRMLRNLISLTKKSFNENARIRHINKLGSIHYIQGQFNHQLETLKDAYHLVNKYQASINKTNILSNMALAHCELANYSSALSLIEEVKLSFDKFHRSDLPTYYFSIGARTFMFFGELYRDKYYEYLDSLEKTALRSNNKISLGHMNLRYGDYKYYDTKYENGAKYYSKALNLFQETNARDDMLEALLRLSLAHRFINDYENAREYAKRAAKIIREINCGYLKPLYSYVIALTEYHDDLGTLAPLLEAIETCRAYGTRELTWQIQFQLARHYKKVDDISNSVKYCRESMNILKEITESFDNSDQIYSYLQVPLRQKVFDFVKNLNS